MRSLQVLCLIGVAGLVLARPQDNKSRMYFGYKHMKSGDGSGGGVSVKHHPMSPLGVLHNRYGLSKSVNTISHRQKVLSCELCPPEKDISPCKCMCNSSTGAAARVNTTAPNNASVNCAGPQLQSANELQKILSSTSYPIHNYSSLLVEKTPLNGAITKSMLGTTVRFSEINMNENGFMYIDKNAFNYSGSILKKLRLNNNQITQMAWSLLEDMPVLKYMDISQNRLTFIPGDAMRSEHLRFLNFSHNNLGEVGMNAFKGLTSLEHLDLSHNALVDLGSSVLAFNNHENIHLSVNLSHNQIYQITGEPAISGVKSISIDLKYNHLEVLKEEVFMNFIDSTNGGIHINVTGNPIACDCQLKWIVQNTTLAHCFDDFPVCNSHLSNITTEDLGDC